MKKLLIGLTVLFSFLFISNVNALETLYGTFPDVPIDLGDNYSDNHFAIIKRTNGEIYLFMFSNSIDGVDIGYTYTVNDTYISFNSAFRASSKSSEYSMDLAGGNKAYRLDNNSWTYIGTSSVNYMANALYFCNIPIYNAITNTSRVQVEFTGEVNTGPKIYNYEDEIDTSNIDFIRFKLDVNDIIFNENFVQFNYSLNGNSKDRLLYPYIETLYDYYLTADDNETSTVLYKTYELSTYSNNIFEIVNQDFNSTVYYNFVIDTRNFNDNLFLNFDSYYNFEVEIYNSDGTSEVLYNTGSTLASNDYLPAYNMVTVDLSDYKGVVLVPKVYSTTDNLGLIYNAIKYDQDYKIFLNGNYDIYIRSTPGNYVTLTDTFKDYSNLYFSKRFKYVSFIDNKNTNIIRLVKSSSNENHLITFDSNMYSYSFINSSDEVVILPDPNLPDNTINTGTIDEDVSLDEANNTFQDSELSITKFINDIDETLNYVHNVFNIFFNKLPILIQSLLIFVFNIVCIFMLLRMGGWLG